MFITFVILIVIASSTSLLLTYEIKTWWIDYWYNLLSLLITSFIFWYMWSVINGTCGLIKTLVFIKTSKRTFKLTYMFYSSTSPFSLCLFNRTYQFVSIYKNLINSGTTLYNLYSFIYLLTFFIKNCKEDNIHLSVTLNLA